TAMDMTGDSPSAVAVLAAHHYAMGHMVMPAGSSEKAAASGMSGMDMSSSRQSKKSPRDRYQPVSCPGDNGVHNLFAHHTSYQNGRTECVIADADGTPAEGVLCPGDRGHDNCYIDYEPYQQDTVQGDSEWDRGAALRYHNGEKYAPMDAHMMMTMNYTPGC